MHRGGLVRFHLDRIAQSRCDPFALCVQTGGDIGSDLFDSSPVIERGSDHVVHEIHVPLTERTRHHKQVHPPI